MFKSISKDEWKFLIIIWLAINVIVFLPMIFGYFMTPSDSIFLFRRDSLGLDYPVYFSQIDQAKQGVYFFKDLFTQESQAVGLLNPFWSLVGILATVFSVSSFVALHLASFLLIPVFLVSSYYLISYFLEEKVKRKICFVFFIFASGFGGWPLIFGNFFMLPTVTTPESFSLTTLSGSPHFIASSTLLILIFLFSLYAFEKHKIIYSISAGFCALALFSFHPYHLYTVVFVFLAFLITEFLIDKKIYFEHIRHYIIVMLFSMPPIIYYLWAFINIPVRHETFSQNITLTPALWIVLIDYSAFIILAIFGLISIFKNRKIDKKIIFLIVWCIVQFFLIYLPVNTQRRLFEGLNIPLIILGTYGLFFLNDWLKNNSKLQSLHVFYRAVSILFLILIFCTSNAFFFFYDFYFFKDSSNHVFNGFVLAYLPKDDENALLWIKENTPLQSVVLSWGTDGNIIPVIDSRPVYQGFTPETTEAMAKGKIMQDFFKRYNSQERKDFLETNKINYLFWGSEEKKIAKNFNPDKESFLQKVYSNSTAAVYKIK
jgi:hypothetical protein